MKGSKLAARVGGVGVLIAVALAILAVPYFPWGFMRDDWGCLAHAAAYVHDWAVFFKAHNVMEFVYPDGSAVAAHSWMGSFYRPFQFVEFALEYLVFKTNAYAYLIFITLLHASIVSLLFWMATHFFSWQRALFVALLILFHSMIMLWLGVFTIQIYIFDALYFLGVTLLLKKWIDSHKLIWYAASCGVYVVSLLAKETLLLYPGWVFVAVIFYLKKKDGDCPWLKAGCTALACASGYALLNVGYLGARYLIFNGATGSEPRIFGFASWHEFCVRQSQRLFDLVTYVCNYLYVGVVPGGNRLLKFGLVLLVMLILVYPFYKKRQLALLSFLCFSILAVSWPAWLLYYHTRYAYTGLIFLYVIMLFALDFYLDQCAALRRVSWGAGLIVLIGLSWHAVVAQTTKNKVLVTVYSAVENLAQQVQYQPVRPLLFVGLPHWWFASGGGQMVKLLTGQFDRPAYVNMDTMLQGGTEYGPLIQYPVQVMLEANRIEVCIQSGSCVSFVSAAIATETAAVPDPITRVTYIPEEELLAQNPIIIAWDYVGHQFRVLRA